MALREITAEEFENYNFAKSPALIGIAEERFWYSDDEANIIGTVLLDNIDKDWSYVIMALEDDREFRYADGAVSLDSEDDAIDSLTLKMREMARVGKIEANLYHSSLFDPKSAIIVKDIDEEIKRFFKKYPQRLYEMNPRTFEELIASILEDFGFDVELTKATRDGGRDIIASVRSAVANFLTYVECKRYAPENKIDVGLIRQVSGVHYLRKPSKSIIVTTGFYTKDAQEEAKLIENQLELKDFNHIKDWLERY